MDWYPFYVHAYQTDTLHLTCLQDGAYRRLIDHYYATRGPIPNNDIALARIVGLPVDEWLEISCAIRPFFKVKSGKLVHSRCERELAEMVRRSEKKSAAAKKGGKIKALKSQADSAPAQHVPATLTLTKKEEDLALHRDPVLTSNIQSSSNSPAAAAKDGFPWISDPDLKVACAKVHELCENSPNLVNFGRIREWIKAGAILECDVYETIATIMRRRPGNPPNSLSYFDRAVAEAIATRTRPMPEGRPANVVPFDPQEALRKMREAEIEVERAAADTAAKFSDGASQ